MNKKNFTLIATMFVPIILGDFLFIHMDGAVIYPLYYSVFSLLYIVPYFYMVLFRKEQIPFKNILFFFLILKCYLFLSLNINDSLMMYRLELNSSSDVYRYHIPHALTINSIEDILDHIFNNGINISGKLTHTLIALNGHLLGLFGFTFTKLDAVNIGKIMFIFNIILNTLTLYIIYLATLQYSGIKEFANRAVFFVAFNPFFLHNASTAKKEALLMFALALLLWFLVVNKRNYFLFVIIFIVFLLERSYMALFSVFIYLYLLGFKKFVVISGMLFYFFVYIYDISFLSEYTLHLHALKEDLSTSMLDDFNIFFNLARALFAPFFLRPFMNEYFNGQFLEFVYAALYLFFGWVAIKSIQYYKDNMLSIVFLVYLFTFFVVPMQSTFKIMVLSIFTVIFLDKISFVKYIKAKEYENIDLK